MAKNKIKVPKRIGGLKVPKAIRKAPVVTALLNNPLGRDILAGALVAGAGAATAALARHHPSAEQLRDAGEAAASAGGRRPWAERRPAMRPAPSPVS